jgi:hypothetical protein
VVVILIHRKHIRYRRRQSSVVAIEERGKGLGDACWLEGKNGVGGGGEGLEDVNLEKAQHTANEQ